ncbi:hypothetical protein HAX54_024374 [Datura stramonium]|uniref:Uncharacterized protein n=1 Tax=Datura stramonium TaxID=4076 RepID=A0ABS8UZA7_DATST|nr:hypothetical protein [Datura stramonium]
MRKRVFLNLPKICCGLSGITCCFSVQVIWYKKDISNDHIGASQFRERSDLRCFDPYLLLNRYVALEEVIQVAFPTQRIATLGLQPNHAPKLAREVWGHQQLQNQGNVHNSQFIRAYRSLPLFLELPGAENACPEEMTFVTGTSLPENDQACSRTDLVHEALHGSDPNPGHSNSHLPHDSK